MTLTVQPGTIIKADANTQIVDGGSLVAKGTAASPITLTSINDNTVGGATGTGTPAEGDWDGVATSTSKAKLNIEHTKLAYGSPGVSASTSGATTLTHDTFVQSPVQINSGGTLLVQGDSWSGTADPLSVTAGDLSGVTGNTFSGGAADEVVFYAGSVANNWTLDTGEIAVADGVTVNSGATMTVPAGSLLKVGSAGSVSYAPGLAVAGGGALRVSGTSGSPVQVTSACNGSAGTDTSQNDQWCVFNNEPGWIYVDSGSTGTGGALTATNLQLSQIQFEDGNQTGSNGGASSPAITINNSTLQSGVISSDVSGFTGDNDSFTQFSVNVTGPTASGGAGVSLAGDSFSASPVTLVGWGLSVKKTSFAAGSPASLDATGAVVVQGDSWSGTAEPLSVTAGDLSGVTGNTFSGGAADEVVFYAGSVANNWTLDAGEIAVADGVTVDGGATVTLPAGLLLKVGSAGSVSYAPGLAVAGGGALRVSGTSGSPVQVTSACNGSAGTDTSQNDQWCVFNNEPGWIYVDSGSTGTGGSLTATGAQFSDIQIQDGNQTGSNGGASSPAITINNSTLQSGVISSDVSGFTGDNDSFTQFSVNVTGPTASGGAGVSLAGDSFSASPVTLVGWGLSVTSGTFAASSAVSLDATGEAVVQGDSWSGTADPLSVTAGDLSGVTGNTFSGGAADEVVFYAGSVANNWTLDTGEIAVTDGVTVNSGATMTVPAGLLLKVGSVGTVSYAPGLAVAGGGALEMPGTAGAPVQVTSACNGSAGADTSQNDPWCVYNNEAGWIFIDSGASGPGGSLTAANLQLDEIQFQDGNETGSGASSSSPSVTIDNSNLQNGTISFGGMSDLTISGDSLSSFPVVAGQTSTSVVSGDQWQDTSDPLTVESDDLSGISDNNTASGSSQSDQLFDLSGHVPDGADWQLSPESGVIYSLGDVTIDEGGTAECGDGCLIWNADITDNGDLSLDGADLEDSSVSGSWSGIDVSAGGELTVEDSVMDDGDVAINAAADSSVDVSGTEFTDNETAIAANQPCEGEPDTADVTVDGSSFDGNGFAIENCDSEVPEGEPVEAVGNSGLDEGDVSTHSDECVWADPDPENPPPDGVYDYALSPIWDVNIGVANAECDIGYAVVKE